MAKRAKPTTMPTASETSDRQFVSALARGLEIMKCFDATHTELGSMDLSEMTGFPQPTVWRLCHTLVKCGYLVQSVRNDKFRVGLGILSLGHSAIWSSNRRDLVLQEMENLARLSNCAVSLAVPDKGDMIIIERCIPQATLIVNLQVGSRLPIASSAIGWAYLAALPDAARQSVIKAIGLNRNPDLKQEIARAMSQYQECGYVKNVGQFHPEVVAIAVPIAMADSNQFLSINCGGPATNAEVKMLEKTIAPRLMALAGSIGKSLSTVDFPLLKLAHA